MKWSDMHKTLKDDEVESDEDEEDETAKDPVMRFETVPHRGCVNRIRSMHGSSIVATWSDENEVGIYDLTSAYEALEQPPTGKGGNKKPLGGNKLACFKHSDEGYALDWSPLTLGRLASGGCNA
jgi:ribosome assembly protein RRB1